MSVKPSRPCRQPGCPSLAVKDGYCEKHRKIEQQASDARRGTPSERGYDAHWHKVRQMHLNEYPLCHDCESLGLVTAGTEVHHIKALNDGGTNDDDNLMSLCHECHSRRTAKEQGFAKK